MSSRRTTQLLRLCTLTCANFGGPEGSETVDRPLATDPWTDLPYVPWSAIKGVLASPLGDIEDSQGKLNPDRAPHFGRPSSDGEGPAPGESDASPTRELAGSTVFGDGLLLGFHLRRANGAPPLLVVVASTLHRIARFPGLPFRTVHWIDDLAATDYAGGVVPRELPATPRRLRHRDADIDENALRWSLGNRWRPGAQRTIIAADAAAHELWQCAVETRIQTALTKDKTVRSGSLRSVELVPPETLFLCAVTMPANDPHPPWIRERLIQLGAWENIGLGFTTLEALGTYTPTTPLSEKTKLSRSKEPYPDHLRPAVVVLEAFRAVRALEATDYAAEARTVLRAFGPRWHREGLPRALAFMLAKAAHDDAARPSASALAHRWCLQRLLDRPSGTSAELQQAALKAIVNPGEHEQVLAARLRWLRSYAEATGAQSGSQTAVMEAL